MFLSRAADAAAEDADSRDGASDGSLQLLCQSGDSRVRSRRMENALYVGVGDDPYELLQKGFTAAAARLGTFAPKAAKTCADAPGASPPSSPHAQAHSPTRPLAHSPARPLAAMASLCPSPFLMPLTLPYAPHPS